MVNNYIWLFGENLGKTADNNSFYLWKKVVNINDDVEKYIISIIELILFNFFVCK